MLFARRAKSALGSTDSGANFREIKRRAGVGLQVFLKPYHDRFVIDGSPCRFNTRGFGEAPDHDVNELLLQCSAHLRLVKEIGDVMSELSHTIMYPEQS
jgi:hypothetical protein